ncbi:MAG: type II secretion system minor pseudopilin GspJ [Betaproteobacteria bacterium]
MTDAGGERPPHGFTLVELLIALAILGLLSVLGYRAIAALATSETRLAAEAERWRTLDHLFARLEADCRTAQPRDVRTGESIEPAWLGNTDDAGNGVLHFSRGGSEFVLEPGSAGQRIGYRLRAGAIEVMYWPGLDQPANAVPAVYPLAADVASMHLSYLDSRGGWRERWPVFGEPKVPRALRIDVRLANGEVIERWLALQ